MFYTSIFNCVFFYHFLRYEASDSDRDRNKNFFIIYQYENEEPGNVAALSVVIIFAERGTGSRSIAVRTLASYSGCPGFKPLL
jgi:hypothetical protein